MQQIKVNEKQFQEEENVLKKMVSNKKKEFFNLTLGYTFQKACKCAEAGQVMIRNWFGVIQYENDEC